MKIKRIAGVVVGTTVMFSVCALTPAAAVNNIKGFGVQETLKDFYSLSDFSSEIGYTIADLKPSGDAVAYPVAGRLYEANVTADAVVGSVVPHVNDFVARTPGGVDYRALTTVSTLSGAPLGPGDSTFGKLYFDVVGDHPDSVVYNRNFEDLLGWVGLPPVEVTPGTSAGGGSSSGGTSAGNGGTGVSGSTGPDQVTPPSISDGAQNGPYGPSGSTPPVGNDNGNR